MNRYRVRSAENVVDEFMELNEAGYESVMIVDDDFLTNRERASKIMDEIRKAVNLSREMGFFTLGNFILGAPFETMRHFEKTIKFAESLPLDAVAFYTLEYEAGSQLWEEAVLEGKIASEEYLVFSDSRRRLSEFTKEEIEAYCKIAHKRFYLRPEYWLDQFFQAVRRRNFRSFRAVVKILGM